MTDAQPPSSRHRAGSPIRRRHVVFALIAAVVVAVSITTVVALFPNAEPSDAAGRHTPSGSADTAMTGTGSPAAGPSASSSASAAPAADGNCHRSAGASPTTAVTQVSVGTKVTGAGQQGDTDPLPMAIAATPSGGSWLAWLGPTARSTSANSTARTTWSAPLPASPASTCRTSRPTRTAACCCSPARVTATPGRCAAGVQPLQHHVDGPLRQRRPPGLGAPGHQPDRQPRRVRQRRPVRLVVPAPRPARLRRHELRRVLRGGDHRAERQLRGHPRGRPDAGGQPSGALVSGHGSFEVGCSHAWTHGSCGIPGPRNSSWSAPPTTTAG